MWRGSGHATATSQLLLRNKTISPCHPEWKPRNEEPHLPFHLPFGILSKTQAACKVVVVRRGCNLDTSVVTLKILMSGPCPRSIKSEFLGYSPGHTIFKKHLRWFKCATKVENLLNLDSFPLKMYVQQGVHSRVYLIPHTCLENAWLKTKQITSQSEDT